MSNEVKAAIAAMQSKRGEIMVWANANGTFSHRFDAQRQWDDEASCRTDLRFHQEWAR